MIDTLDVFYHFQNKHDYDLCYASIDQLSRVQGQALHKHEEKKAYITTAFSSFGVLQIAFCKTKYHRTCRILLQPICLLYPNSHIRLAEEADFAPVCHYFDKFMDIINKKCGDNILPPLRSWRVKRIDYAVNIATPYAVEYVRLFYAGAVPAGFTIHQRYADSYYLSSKHGNINFYDKLRQAHKKYGVDDGDIINEFPSGLCGILRLEFQCSSKYIQHLKERYHLEDTTLPYLWSAEIAAKELKKRVKSVIGKTPFCFYEDCKEKLSRKYENRTLSLCSQIVQLFRDHPRANLNDVKDMLSESSRQQFPLLLHKIRKAGVNPIPLESCCTPDNRVLEKVLDNPYQLIDCGNDY